MANAVKRRFDWFCVDNVLKCALIVNAALCNEKQYAHQVMLSTLINVTIIDVYLLKCLTFGIRSNAALLNSAVVVNFIRIEKQKRCNTFNFSRVKITIILRARTILKIYLK